MLYYIYGNFLLFKIQTFYCWAKDAAVGVTKRIAESAVEVPEVKVCTAALLLMLQVLNWDFQQSITGTKTGINVFMPGVKVNSSTSKKTECAIVQVTKFIILFSYRMDLRFIGLKQIGCYFQGYML